MSIFENQIPQDEEDEFLQTRLSFAVVFKASLAEIQEIKHLLTPFSRQIVFQRTSGDYLWVVPRKEARKK